MIEIRGLESFDLPIDVQSAATEPPVSSGFLAERGDFGNMVLMPTGVLIGALALAALCSHINQRRKAKQGPQSDEPC